MGHMLRTSDMLGESDRAMNEASSGFVKRTSAIALPHGSGSGGHSSTSNATLSPVSELGTPPREDVASFPVKAEPPIFPRMLSGIEVVQEAGSSSQGASMLSGN